MYPDKFKIEKDTCISSFIDGHLGCFHVLAIVNSAAMNDEIHVSFSILNLSGYMPILF